MMNSIKTYGIKEQTVLSDELSHHIENIQLKGFSVVNDLINEDQLIYLRNSLDQIYSKQADEVGGGDKLSSINDEFIARLPLSEDKAFLDISCHPTILDILNQLLGDYYILMLQNGIINMPSEFNFQSSWHRDLNYQHFTTSRPISMSVLFCIDDFKEETGGTFFLPYSHNAEQFPSEKFIQENEMTVEVKAGGAIIFNSMVYHRAGHNRSSHIRRGLNNMYVLPFIKQQIDIPTALGDFYASDPFYSKFLGYASQSSKNALDFRTKRLNK